MKFFEGILGLAACAVLSVAVTSCGGGGGGGSVGSIGNGEGVVVAADTGTVTLLATDAVTDEFKEINLTIVRAELLSDDGPQTLFTGEKQFDLLSLAEVTEVFSVSEVPAGSYNKIRLILTEIELVFHDDREPAYPKLPGNGKLDLNPKGAFYVDSDNPLAIQLDFDAEKSIHIVGAGKNQEKYNFRPVVFIKTVENEYDTKLIRQKGTVYNLDSNAGQFDLCLGEFQAQAGVEDGPEDCVRVDTKTVPAAIFSEYAEPASIAALANGDMVTVVGRFFLDSQLVSANAVNSSELRSIKPGAVVTAQAENPNKPDKKDKGGGSEDDDSEDDNSDDVSEDDDSEDDVSEDDVSEDDDSEDDVSEDDDSDDDSDRPKMVLAAELVWKGSGIVQTENVACSSITEGGSQYDNTELPVPEGEECGDSSRLTILQPGARVYDDEGRHLNSSSIIEGVLNSVDGFTAPEEASAAVKAVMVMLALEQQQGIRQQQTGIIGTIEQQSLTLLTAEGDRCVSFEAGETEVFETDQDGEGNIVFSQMDIPSLASGQQANAFGAANIEGCLEADTIIYENVE